ncbi:MAG: hypothetical protein ACI9HK_000280, partial [Pirellulaceae bacterium]
HNPFTGPLTANVNITVIRVPAKSVAALRQLLVEFV